jgi:deoxyribodipyrimidine photo-lyase
MPHGARPATGHAALVWFKRDLRVRDHAPLAEAMHFESALGLVVIEPPWLNSPECDPRDTTLRSPICSAMKRPARAGATNATGPWPRGVAARA